MLVLRKLDDVIGDVAKLKVRIPVVSEIRSQFRVMGLKDKNNNWGLIVL